MTVQANEFDRRITIERFDTAYRDERGNDIGGWREYYKCSAGIVTNGGNAAAAESRIDYNHTVEFKIRYCRAAAKIVPEEYRVLYNGAYWRILSVFDVNAAHTLIKISAVTDDEGV